MRKLFDMHLHLQDKDFEDDIDAVIERALQKGVSGFVCNSTGRKDWEKVAELAGKYPFIIPCYGIHPWYAGKKSLRHMEDVEVFIKENPKACIGETGLDGVIKTPDMEVQEEVFRCHIRLACKYNRPLMIHCVGAWGLLCEALESEQLPKAGFLVHSFGGSVEVMERLVGMGGYFSFSGYALKENSKKMRQALEKTPLDRLFIETDSPDIFPPEGCYLYGQERKNGKKRNEPANLSVIFEKIADIRKEDKEVLADALWQNMERFLNV